MSVEGHFSSASTSLDLIVLDAETGGIG
jgi:hypothetical protein